MTRIKLEWTPVESVGIKSKAFSLKLPQLGVSAIVRENHSWTVYRHVGTMQDYAQGKESTVGKAQKAAITALRELLRIHSDALSELSEN